MKKFTLFFSFFLMMFGSNALDLNLIKHLEGTSRAVAVYGDYCYFSQGRKIKIFDVSDPGNITMANLLMLSGNSSVNTMFVDAGKELLFIEDSKTMIYSLADPAAPVLLSEINNTAYKVICLDDILILASADNIYFYDISNPSSPVQVSSIYVENSYGKVCIKDNYLYSFLKQGYCGSHIIESIDISDISNPQYVGPFVIGPDTATIPEDLMIKDDYIIIALGDSLRTFEITGGGNIENHSGYKMSGVCKSFDISGNMLIAGLDNGIKIYDISDLENIQETGGYEWETFYRDIYMENGMIYAAGNTGGFKILDFDDNKNITELYYFPYTDFVKGVCINSNIAYFNMYERGLQAVDISNPVFPVNLGNCEAPFMDYLKYYNGVIYGMMENGNDTIRLYNVSNPDQISFANYLTAATLMTDMVFTDYYMIVYENDNGIRVYDLSDPLNPEEAGFTSYTGGNKLAVEDNTLYIAGQYGMMDTAKIRISAFDISNLPQMTFLGDYFFDDIQFYHPQKIMTDQSHLYLGTWKGLVAMDFDGTFEVKNELFYNDPSYTHSRMFMKDGDYIYFYVDYIGTKAIKIINGTEFQEEPVNIDIFTSAKQGTYFYSIDNRNGYSIYSSEEYDFPSPQNFVVTADGCTLQMSWEVPDANPGYFLIYANNKFLDSVTGTSYEYTPYFSSYNNFYIIAGYLDPPGLSLPSDTVNIGIPGGNELPYIEDFEGDCINWYSSTITGNDEFYHCNTESYEGDYCLAFNSSSQGAKAKCGAEYLPGPSCTYYIVKFMYKIPSVNENYDKLSLYVDTVMLVDELEPSNDWKSFAKEVYLCTDFNLYFVAEGNNGAGIFIDDYKVLITDNINEAGKNNTISVFPNPAKEMINVTSDYGNMNLSSVEIVSLSGQTVKRLSDINGQSISLDTGDLNKGVYFIKVISENKVFVRKIVIE